MEYKAVVFRLEKSKNKFGSKDNSRYICEG